MNLYNVIVRPIVTEKGVQANAQGKHSFYVHKESTKIDVKNAVELLYGVKVSDVNILQSPRKERVIGRGKVMTKRQGRKKAVITLQDKKKAFDPLKIKTEK